jgi:hypothetical protein
MIKFSLIFVDKIGFLHQYDKKTGNLILRCYFTLKSSYFTLNNQIIFSLCQVLCHC